MLTSEQQTHKPKQSKIRYTEYYDLQSTLDRLYACLLYTSDQPAPAKAEAPETEDASKVVTPPTAEKPVEGKTAPDSAGEQPAPGGKEVPDVYKRQALYS